MKLLNAKKSSRLEIWNGPLVKVFQFMKTSNANPVTINSLLKKSIGNLASCGIKIITYNFMPVLDWTRMDLRFNMPDSSTALRFESAAFATFDLFIVKRLDSKNDYSKVEFQRAENRFKNVYSRY